MAQDSGEHLTRFLLGELPEAEAERLEELSISDDALAARLRAIEEDIVDRYARGEIGGSLRTRVEHACQASPYLQEKVRFAAALHGWTAQGQAGRPELSPQPRTTVRAWAAAAAVILLIGAVGYLARTNQRLRSEVAQVTAQRLAVESERTELQRQLDARPVQSPPPLSAPVIATVLLQPPRRGAERDPAVVTLRNGTTQVAFRVEVESDAYPRFWAGLKEVDSSAIVWRSRDVAGEAAGANRIATIVVPAEVLRPQRYVIELTGIGKNGESELLGVYAVRVAFE